MSSSFRLVVLGIGLASAAGWFAYNQFFRIEEIESNVIRRPARRPSAAPESKDAKSRTDSAHSTETVSAPAAARVASETESPAIADTETPQHSTAILEETKADVPIPPRVAVTSETPPPDELVEPMAQGDSDTPPIHSTDVVPESTADPDKLAWRQRLFSLLDADGDGRLTSAELPARWRQELIAGDRDRDGLLDFAEFDRAIIELASQHPPSTFLASDSKPSSTLVAPPPPGKRVPIYIPGGKAKSSLPAWFLERDKNEDGQIGIGEWPANQLDLFQRIDINRDGFITPEEAIRAGAKIGERMVAPEESGTQESSGDGFDGG